MSAENESENNTRNSPEDTALLQSALPDLADLLSKVLYQCDEGQQNVRSDTNSTANISPCDSPRDNLRRRIFLPVQDVCIQEAFPTILSADYPQPQAAISGLFAAIDLKSQHHSTTRILDSPAQEDSAYVTATPMRSLSRRKGAPARQDSLLSSAASPASPGRLEQSDPITAARAPEIEQVDQLLASWRSGAASLSWRSYSPPPSPVPPRP